MRECRHQVVMESISEPTTGMRLHVHVTGFRDDSGVWSLHDVLIAGAHFDWFGQRQHIIADGTSLALKEFAYAWADQQTFGDRWEFQYDEAVRGRQGLHT